MKYRTVIEIISEADNSQDAADLAGEYLLGHLQSGIDMRCSTKRYMAFVKPAVISFSVLIASGLFISRHYAPKDNTMLASNMISQSEAVYAVHPPLRTGAMDDDFNEKWDDKNTSTALQHIKK